MNRPDLPKKISWVRFPKGYAVGTRPHINEDNIMSWAKLPEKNRYLARKFCRYLELMLKEKAPRRLYNEYFSDRLDRSVRQVQRDLWDFQRVGLLKIRLIHHRGTFRDGRWLPLDTYRQLIPFIDFTSVQHRRRSPTPEEWRVFLHKVCARFGLTDLYRIPCSLEKLPGGGYLLKECGSGTIVRREVNSDKIFDGLFLLPDGRRVDPWTWNGR